MQQAVTRVYTALAKGERVVIHGDYDADGVSGSALLFTTLRDISESLGYDAKVEVFLPDRERDGYGVALHTVERLAQEGVTFMVTVDCGIANAKELFRAHELGMDVLICDHHQLGEALPEHAIILHPLAPGEEYPNKKLCGTGVAFKLACALLAEARVRGSSFPEGYEKWLLDLVAIATVTDVVPLLGENRVLESYGLRVLKKTRRPGLLALLEQSGTDVATLDTGAIGFRIGPRLNAAGRMASAKAAFDVLVARDDHEAREHAQHLELVNRERQTVFLGMYKEAEAQIADKKDDPLWVVYAEHWAPGIIGLIAGRLQQDYGKPVFACTKVGDHVVGSGRSMGGLHLVELMKSCGDELFVKRGGHPQACGLTLVDVQAVDVFRERAQAFARAYYGDAGPQDVLFLDARLNPADASWELFDLLEQCAPFGEGNRPPVFFAEGMSFEEIVRMGESGAHARIHMLDSMERKSTFLAFHAGHLAGKLRIGERYDVAYVLEVNTWNGRRSLQYRLIDLRVSLS